MINIFFPGFIILTTVLPPLNEFSIIGCVATIFILTLCIPAIYDLGEILRQRVMIDLVPSESRNAVYSLIPTIVSLLGIFLLPVAGILIEDFGLTAGITMAFVVGLIATTMITIGIYTQKKETDTKAELMVVQPESAAALGP